MFARRLVRSPQLPLHTPGLIPRCAKVTRSISGSSFLQPREFPSSGFEVIDPSQRVEEEKLPFYRSDDYYPMRIGEIIQDRYQVVAKLGYGTGSTVWLSRDLKGRKYWALKVHTRTSQRNCELNVYRHLGGIDSEHPGQENVRRLHDSFTLKGPDGEHDVFVMTPLGMSLRTLQDMQENNAFQQDLVTTALDQVLLGLGYLHESDVIHTDLHSDNLLIAITDDSILSTVEESEVHKPSARKKTDDRIIYVSQYMLGGVGPLTVCDLGQARIGGEHRGNAMPMQYRAPEVMLNMPWGNAVDLWAVGLLAWDLLQGESLFGVYSRESTEKNDAHHLAAMTALLGPPPPEFLRKSEETSRYWDNNGQWRGPVPLPPERKLETLVSRVEGEDKDMFLNFIRRLLVWYPEDRPTSMEAFFHPWLRGKSS
ncbi:Serine/threonine-protein kinase-like protein [Hapsidospora chrysogenum ATCC 11550]|uniref:non-specific serine/threonine protein kinase n=1 Tax=Hapsidospora chrysogenum (strain ATCC 11550 / CBS 779.69 / DSM 880 / IAM 14645 / JCM 23072 / IMI 49137) TaxID=857340 RepID=A0A086T4F8_HAPC1|nr:Serine/threonine-protein kinase-like protein [Hapsidospora chrysogenum ATCC 11550]